MSLAQPLNYSAVSRKVDVDQILAILVTQMGQLEVLRRKVSTLCRYFAVGYAWSLADAVGFCVI